MLDLILKVRGINRRELLEVMTISSNLFSSLHCHSPMLEVSSGRSYANRTTPVLYFDQLIESLNFLGQISVVCMAEVTGDPDIKLSDFTLLLSLQQPWCFLL